MQQQGFVILIRRNGSNADADRLAIDIENQHRASQARSLLH
jgi:hypothetical protein